MAIFLTVIVTVAIYYMMVFSMEVSYFFAYKFKQPHLWADFGRNLWITCDMVFPFILTVTNLILLLVKNNKVSLIAAAIIFIVSGLWFWGWPLLSYWPYRAIPAVCVIAVYFWLDVLIVRHITGKMLYIVTNEAEDDLS